MTSDPITDAHRGLLDGTWHPTPRERNLAHLVACALQPDCHDPHERRHADWVAAHVERLRQIQHVEPGVLDQAVRRVGAGLRRLSPHARPVTSPDAAAFLDMARAIPHLYVPETDAHDRRVVNPDTVQFAVASLTDDLERGTWVPGPADRRWAYYIAWHLTEPKRHNPEGNLPSITIETIIRIWLHFAETQRLGEERRHPQVHTALQHAYNLIHGLVRAIAPHGAMVDDVENDPTLAATIIDLHTQFVGYLLPVVAGRSPTPHEQPRHPDATRTR